MKKLLLLLTFLAFSTSCEKETIVEIEETIVEVEVEKRDLVEIPRPAQLPTDKGMLGATWYIYPGNTNYFVGLTRGGDYRVFTHDTTWVNGADYAAVVFQDKEDVLDWLDAN